MSDLEKMSKMTTIESEELRSPYVIAELNNKIANKEIWRLRIYNEDNLMFSLLILDFKNLRISSTEYFFSVSNLNPYFNFILLYTEFTSIEYSNEEQ